MARGKLIVLLMLAGLLLVGCMAKPVNSVYTASGDGTKPADLTKTKVFKPDDDLNLVVRLNAHDHELAVYAVFTAPTGETYPTDPLGADVTVGEIVLGLDWEAMAGQMWPEGEWTAAVYVDEEQKESITFQVQATTTNG